MNFRHDYLIEIEALFDADFTYNSGAQMGQPTQFSGKGERGSLGH